MNALFGRLNSATIAGLMGLEAKALAGIPWLVLQEDANGVERSQIAKQLGVDEETLVELVKQTLGEDDTEKANQKWQQGIVAIRAVLMSNQNTLVHGWDAIEALAVDKLARSLMEMGGNGKPSEMLAIAKTANSALRRTRGESQRGDSRGGNGTGQPEGGSMTVDLNGGHLGSIRLTLSPRIQAQLGNPDRIIDGVAYAVPQGKLPLQMLSLKETRGVVDEHVRAKQSAPESEGEPEPKKHHAKEMDTSLLEGLFDE